MLRDTYRVDNIALRGEGFSGGFPGSSSDFIDSYRHFALQEGPDLMPADSAGNIVLSDVDYVATWRQMEACVRLGLTRSIGLSNFNSQQIDRLLANAEIKPVNLQVMCCHFHH